MIEPRDVECMGHMESPPRDPAIERRRKKATEGAKQDVPKTVRKKNRP